ncbi:hypothetical protein OU489_002176 [Enterococcus hirae]|uniref:hypothetical protein n=1 Tax=Enterococcus hirae TaxID=1354 RepID=UPI002953BCEB|nr:hypothetical protein [Enterococcus hirae]EMF0107944.1 hypothetical protein [Enterococcus hirae]MDV7772415.1 hypothetical protein [Enterococcus hirae]
MEDKIILTKSELQEMLNRAASYGKAEVSIDSPLFNPNILFQAEGKFLKDSVEEIQISGGRIIPERWGNVTEIRGSNVHDQVRKLVLSAYFAKYNTEIPIDKRIRAKQLYSKISQLFLDEFQKNCFE